MKHYSILFWKQFGPAREHSTYWNRRSAERKLDQLIASNRCLAPDEWITYKIVEQNPSRAVNDTGRDIVL
jgi:hypothetical protein